MGDRVVFVWKDEARFKHLLSDEEARQSALASFGISVGHLLTRASEGLGLTRVSAFDLRQAILKSHEVVDLQNLLAACWAVGIPVIQLRMFPLDAHKGMHAMAVRSLDRFSVLLARDAQYPAPIAFDLAHELGHIMLGHLANAAAIVDDDDPGRSRQGDDDEEIAADRYALELLTGRAEPDIRTNISRFTGRQLSRAAKAAGKTHHIEPGTLALCTAFGTQQWASAMAALKDIYGAPRPVWREVNEVARDQLTWLAIGDDASDFLIAVMGMSRES
jgi:Zn-dependent peptidase ImmA (M78 family)